MPLKEWYPRTKMFYQWKPHPRINLTRFHGVFAPNSKHRAHVTPAKRGKGSAKAVLAASGEPQKNLCERRAAITWMERLKRVFNIDLELCEACGQRGHVKVTACIDDPVVIKKILTPLKQQEQTGQSADDQQSLFPEDRGPPELDSGRDLFD